MKISALVTPVRSFEDQNLLTRYSQKHICNCEVLLTRTSRLSPSVENVLAYFMDTETFPEV